MPLHPTWEDISLRLLLTVIAGAFVGLNREMDGHPAGLRTTILVSLAACTAMIQANLLLPLEGKSPDSFISMDVLRFPLGVLTGVGFIGGGAILRRGNLVTGVTTAATLWVMTAIGLCFGGGQLGIGIAATAIAFATLWLLKWFEGHISRHQRASLALILGNEDAIPDLSDLLESARYKTRFVSRRRQQETGKDIVSYDVRWQSAGGREPALALLKIVATHYSIEAFELVAEPEH
jgi:putative Mg2+ transporter-C (MgtC) family protein